MKLQKQSIRKIDISQINVVDNIRKQYDDIELLARSIERDGQLQPIGVSEQEDGTFNMLYGFRRLNAFLFLIHEGKDYNQIEAKITTGDPAIIQLIENIHRDNLKPIEFENGLQTLIDSGLTQKEIANRLNIRQTRVSDALASKKTRDSLKKKDIDTSEMSTSTISALRSVPEEKQKEVVEKVKKKGGTVKAVKEVLGVKTIKTTEMPAGTIKQELKEVKIPGDLDRKTPKLTEEEAEEKAHIEISIQDFLHLAEVKEIITKENYILRSTCKHCGKEI